MDKVVRKGVKLDLHIHSVYSRSKDKDKVANNTLENLPVLIQRLIENEIELCAITDHDEFNYEIYKELFQGFDLAKLVPFRKGIFSNKWFYSLEINRDRISASMREIITGIQEYNVETRAIWGLINEQIPYQNEFAYEMEKAPYYANRILNIPSSTQITKEEIVMVADVVKKVLSDFAQNL